MSVCLQLEWNSYRPGSWEPQRFLFQQLPLLSPSVCPPSSPFTAPTEWTVNQDLGAFLFYTFPRDSCEIPSPFRMTIKKKITKEIIRQDVIYLYCKCYLQTTDQKNPIHFRLFTCIATETIATMTGVQMLAVWAHMFIHIQSHVLCFLVVSSVHQVFNIFIFFPPVLFADIETLFLVIIDLKNNNKWTQRC